MKTDFTPSLVYEHGVSMRKGGPAHVLAADPHVEALPNCDETLLLEKNFLPKKYIRALVACLWTLPLRIPSRWSRPPPASSCVRPRGSCPGENAGSIRVS